MKRISTLIAELKAYQDEHGDVLVTGRYDGMLKTFSFGEVKSTSLRQSHGVVPLVEIKPGTQAWRDYCDEVNGD